MEGYYQIFDTIVRTTDSSLILFFVILAVMVLPLYGLLLKDRKAARQHDKDMQVQHTLREDRVLEVVRDTTAAITKCSTVITGAQRTIERIHDRLFDAPATHTG